MSEAKKYTVYFPDPKLLDTVELWGRKQRLSLNESIRKALSITVGYGTINQDDRLTKLEEKMESILKFLKQQGVEI